MNKRSPFRSRRATLMFFTAMFAVLLAVAATGLWHAHDSAREAAACTVCHVGSTPTQPQPASISLAPQVFTVEGLVVIPGISGHSAPVFSSKSPRAPPVAS
ncbi:MAG TPA: hypothetical protein VKR82_13555 [Candidatus Acidoferrales bacterium]|nr:hypothetical protein [Candidatus Acidoferrales bacterium]